MKPKDYDKVLGEKKKREPMKLLLKPFKAVRLNFPKTKRFISTAVSDYDYRLSYRFVVVIAVCVFIIVSAVFVANRIRMNYFAQVVTQAYPDIAKGGVDDQGRALYRSPLDITLSEFQANTNVGYLVILAIVLRNFFKTIFMGINPRKVQVLGKG
jgi:hypothetical protein